MRHTEIDGLEIHGWVIDQDLRKVFRQSFRVPIDENDDVTVRINNQRFNVINISAQGIGIHLKAAEIFCVGDILDAIELNLNGEKLGLKGKVCHITPHSPGHYLCGMEFLDMDESVEQKLRDFIHGYQAKLFNQK